VFVIARWWIGLKSHAGLVRKKSRIPLCVAREHVSPPGQNHPAHFNRAKHSTSTYALMLMRVQHWPFVDFCSEIRLSVLQVQFLDPRVAVTHVVAFAWSLSPPVCQ